MLCFIAEELTDASGAVSPLGWSPSLPSDEPVMDYSSSPSNLDGFWETFAFLAPSPPDFPHSSKRWACCFFFSVPVLVCPSSRSVRLHGVLKHILACKCEWKGRGGSCVRHFGFFPGLPSVWAGRLFGDISAEKVLRVSFSGTVKSLKRGWNAVLLRCRAAWITTGKHTVSPSFPVCFRELGGYICVCWIFLKCKKNKKRKKKEEGLLWFVNEPFFRSRPPGYHESLL